MRIEIPELKRCCCCLPLRYGLLVWSYLLLITLGHYSIEYFIIIKNYVRYHFEDHWVEAAMYTVGFLLLVVNFGLTIVIIVAAHKKSIRLLKVYYKYALLTAIATFASEILWLAKVTVYYLAEKVTFPVWKHMILRLIFEVVSLGMKLYVLSLVKSEILKLEKNCPIQFTNIAAEAKYSYYEPNSKMIELKNVTAEKKYNNKSMEEKHDNEKIWNNVSVYADKEKGPKLSVLN